MSLNERESKEVLESFQRVVMVWQVMVELVAPLPIAERRRVSDALALLVDMHERGTPYDEGSLKAIATKLAGNTGKPS